MNEPDPYLVAAGLAGHREIGPWEKYDHASRTEVHLKHYRGSRRLVGQCPECGVQVRGVTFETVGFERDDGAWREWVGPFNKVCTLEPCGHTFVGEGVHLESVRRVVNPELLAALAGAEPDTVSAALEEFEHRMWVDSPEPA